MREFHPSTITVTLFILLAPTIPNNPCIILQLALIGGDIHR